MLGAFSRMGQRMVGTGNDIEISRNTTYHVEDLNVPILVVHGTEDRLLPFEAHAKTYKFRVANAELLAIDGGEHVAIFTHRRTARPK